MPSLNLDQLREANGARVIRWHKDGTIQWSGADWSNAAAGEMGEACNIVKKIRRHETGMPVNYNTPEFDQLLEMLAEELADTITYIDLLAYYYGIDLSKAIIEKFNKVSIAQDFPERLGEM